MPSFFNAGYAYLQLLPSLSGFPEALEAQLKGLNPELKVRIIPDVDKAVVEANASEAGSGAGKKYSDAFTQMVQSRIRAALEALPAIKPEVDASEAQLAFVELREQLEDLSGKKIGIDIDAADALVKLAEIRDDLRQMEYDPENGIDVRIDATKASTELDSLIAKVHEMDHLSVTMDVKLDQSDYALAEAELAKLRQDAEDTAAKARLAELGLDQDGGSGGHAGYFGRIAQIAAVGGTLGAGLISSTALLAIPAAFTAIGIAAEKSNANVQTALHQLETTAKSVTQSAFSPLIGTFVDLSNQGAKTLQNLKIPLTEAAQASAPLVDELGRGFLAATQAGVTGASAELNKMKPIVDSLSQGFGTLEQGFAAFFATLDTATAGQALTGLFGVVRELLPAIADLLNAVSPLGASLAGLLTSGIKSVATTLAGLGPILNFVAGGIQAVSGFLGAQTPIIVALLVSIRLMTGSWTNLSGAWARGTQLAQSLTGLFDTQSTQFARLASLIGITTAAENQRQQATAQSNAVMAKAAEADAQLAKAKATTTAETTAAAEADAAQTASLDKSSVATRASEEASLEAAAARAQLARADLELTAASEDAAAAEAELAETTDVATFSMGPIIGILGAIGLAVGVFAIQNKKTAATAQDVSSQLIQMGNSVTSVNQNISGSNANLSTYSQGLNKIGSSVTEFSSAYSGSLSTAESYTNGLVTAQKKLSDQVITVTQSFATYDAQGNQNGTTTQSYSETVAELVKQVNGNKDAYDALAPAQKQAVDQYNAFNDILPQAQNALNDTKATIAGNTEALAAQGVTLSSTQTKWNSIGNVVATSAKNFNTATSGIKSLTDAAVAADSAFFSAQGNFKQLDQSVIQASQGVDQAEQQVSSAVHGVAQAVSGVADAEHQAAQAAQGVTQAQQGVVQAQQQLVQSEQQVTQAQQQSKQAQVALTQAKIDAAQAIADLNRQVTDQADSEDDARVRLVQAQQAVTQAGLQNTTLASLGGPTEGNLANYQLLLTLQEAQHNLNDQVAQSSQIQNQANAANSAGVNGSTQVISAVQGITQANQQLQQAQQQVVQSKQGVTQAQEGVANAAYQEQQAHKAVEDASYQEQQAQLSLTTAKQQLSLAVQAKQTAQDNDSRSLTLNSAQGVANFNTVEQLFEANLTATGNTRDATTATIAQTTQLGFNALAVQGVIDKVTGLNGQQAVFGVVGQPSVDMSGLINAAIQQGLNPQQLGFSSAQVGNARASGSGIFPTHATGGLIEGPGTSTSDSILAAGNAGIHRISNGEYVVNAASTSQWLPTLEYINSAPGHASGGLIGGQAIPAANVMLTEMGAMFQTTKDTFGSLGVNVASFPNLPANNPAVQPLAPSPAGATPTGGAIAYTPGSGVAQWATTILQVLAALGQPASWLGTIERRMNQESGGNPNAINLWDSNAKAGHPSMGLMQTILPTYLAYAPPGAASAANIENPYDNIYAGTNYAIHRYGSIAGMNRPGGYDNGGYLPPGLQMVYNATSTPEPVFNSSQWDAIKSGGLSSGGFSGGRIYGDITINGLDAKIDGRIEAADAATGQLIDSGTR